MAKKDKDIFDKIMDWKIFGWFRPFYVKNKEMLLYLFFGVLTTAVSFVTAGISKVLLEQAGIGKGGVSTTSTVISWICAVTFAYITNRIWVFESEAEGKKAIISEAASFYGGRNKHTKKAVRYLAAFYFAPVATLQPTNLCT